MLYQQMRSSLHSILSFFSVVHNINASAIDLNNALSKLSNWVFQWKVSFNHDPSK